VSVLLGNGDGTFGMKTNFVTGKNASSVAIGDVDGDGRPDLAVANEGANTVSVLLGNNDGSFGPKTDYGAGSGPTSVAIGDLNGDGRPDLATANGGSNTVSVLLNVGGTNSVEPDRIPTWFELAPPSPNPFRSRATLDFAIPRPAFVRLEIYDVQGRRIRILQDGVLAPGHYVRSWDGATTSGSAALTGVYFFRFSAPGVELTRKAVLVE